MNIQPIDKGFNQGRIFTEFCDDPKFNLGIVGCQQRIVITSWDKSLPDFTATWGADRNILQIRIIGTQSTGGSNGLVI